MTIKSEIQIKLERVRMLLKASGADAVRFRGVDWFAWATAGGDSSVLFANESGIADAFITLSEAFILTNRIERERLALEVVTPDFEMPSFAWAHPEEIETFVRKIGGTVMSDRPIKGETGLTPAWARLKVELMPEEVVRYQALGCDAAVAVSDALAQASSRISERELAGLACNALWSKGIHPLLTLVGGEERVAQFRHPVATAAPLGSRAMLVVCGRRNGLYANLSRWVYFRDPSDQERKSANGVAAVEAEAFRATQDLQSLHEIYERLKEKYFQLGYPDDIEKHHQGGPCGYLAREAIARPSPRPESFPEPGFLPVASVHTAYAWNPSLTGAKIEDTVYLDGTGKLQVLTVDPRWPNVEVEGRMRPDLWVKK